MDCVYIGLISGTSADGIDAVAVNFENNQIQQLGAIIHPYTENCRNRIFSVQTNTITLDQIGELDTLIAEQFAQASCALMETLSIDSTQIKAIGSHGQTLKHAPNALHPYSLQLGNPSVIAERTQITTIGNFRQRDIAAGGQGAPLVTAFHQAWLANVNEQVAVLNLGGIANLTILDKSSSMPTIGFDCGPANTLMDAWMRREYERNYDEDGQTARAGHINSHLLEQLMQHDYFTAVPPKSADIYQFSLQWLDSILKSMPAIKADDVMSTLCEFSLNTIALAIKKHAPSIDCVVACGGGCKNSFLMESLKARINPMKLEVSDNFGVGSDWVEAIAFAWLAKQTLSQQTGNAPLATGASHACILGGVYYA